jgi:hypothetical protein
MIALGTNAAHSQDGCEIKDHNKIDAAPGGIDRDTCITNGHCWHDMNTTGFPSCYYNKQTMFWLYTKGAFKDDASKINKVANIVSAEVTAEPWSKVMGGSRRKKCSKRKTHKARRR